MGIRISACTRPVYLLFTLSLLLNIKLAHSSQGPDIATGFYNNAKGTPVADLIDSSQSTLDMEIYEMDDPKVIAAIRRALDRGVTVHIVKEPTPVGKTCHVFEDPSRQQVDQGADSCDDQIQLVAEVNNSGGKYVPFEKTELCPTDQSSTCLEHGKIIVIDSKLALISTGNFNTTNLCDLEFKPSTCNRDYSFITDNTEIITSLQKIVEMDLKGKEYDVSAQITSGAQNKITVGPDSLDPMVKFIKSAKNSVQIENQYLKEPNINDALTEVANNGVKVQVVVASACAFGEPSDTQKKKLTKIFQAFDDAGILTKMFNKNIFIDGEKGYLHAKGIVVDGNKGWLGSVNGSTQAVTRNREFGIFFNDADNVGALSDVMTGDFQDPNEESWQDSLDCAENSRKK